MKKVYKLENLDCANCAAKMENAIADLPGIHRATVSFLTQRLTLEVAEEAALPAILSQVEGICHKIEPDCKLIH